MFYIYEKEKLRMKKIILVIVIVLSIILVFVVGIVVIKVKGILINVVCIVELGNGGVIDYGFICFGELFENLYN